MKSPTDNELSSEKLIPAVNRAFLSACGPGRVRTIGNRTYTHTDVSWDFSCAFIKDGQLQQVYVVLLQNIDVCEIFQGTEADVIEVLLDMLCPERESEAVEHLKQRQEALLTPV